MDEEAKDANPSRAEEQELPNEEPQTPVRRRRWNSRNEAETGRLAEELAGRLQHAATVLVDRLFEYYSRLPSQDSSQETPVGLTLPASAIGWLSTQLHPQVDSDLQEDEDHCDDYVLWMGVSMRDRLALLKCLLPRITHVRVTSQEWPPSRPASHKATSSSDVHNFVGQDVGDTDNLSVHSTLTMESAPPPRPSLRSFLYQYYLLQNQPRVDLQLFPSLKVLLLERIPPSWVVNLHTVHDSLELLRIARGCIYNLSEFLFPANGEGETDASAEFGKLSHLKLQHCALGELSGLRGLVVGEISENGDVGESDSMARVPTGQIVDIPPPLSRLPNLVSLSLAHNEIQSARHALAGLSALSNLKRLDLSYNFLTNMRGANFMLGNITTLILTGNRIRSVEGLDRLYSLERLWLDGNNLLDLASVAGLANLPELRTLMLAGNPIAEFKPNRYRVEVFNLFREQRFVGFPPNATYRQLLDVLPLLDGTPASKRELVGLRSLAFSQSVRSPANENHIQDRSDLESTAWLTSAYGEVTENVVLAPIYETKGSNRVRRRTKTRKVFIEDSPSKLLAGLSTKNEDNHDQPHHKGGVTASITTNVQFSLIDVIATLPSLTLTIVEDVNELDVLEPEVQRESTILDRRFSSHHSSRAADDSMVNGHGNSEAYAPLSISLGLEEVEDEGLSFISLSPVKKEESMRVSMSQDHGAASSVDMDESISNPQSPRRNAHERGSPVSQQPTTTTASDDRSERENVITPEPVKDAHVETEDNVKSPQSTSAKVVEPEREDELNEMTPLKFSDVAFPDDVWDDDTSALSSIKMDWVKNAAATSKYEMAEEDSVYDGPDHLKALPVSVNLELYFRGFVFRGSLPDTPGSFKEDSSVDKKLELLLNTAPRIQLRLIDWRSLESRGRNLSPNEIISTSERFQRVWRDHALACGKLAAKRMTPHRKPKRGFHGDVLFSNGKLEKSCEHRKVIMCTSDVALYFISDYDAVTRHQLSKRSSKTKKRRFPSPISEDSLFEHGPWPHALARHPLIALERITIGFGFQRLTLHFRSGRGEGEDNADEFAYILLTANKLKTINILQHLQSLAKDLGSRAAVKSNGEALKIDNDDKQVLDALAVAVAPNVVGVVLHYQIVQQRWQHGDRGTVRRSCIVTDTHLYLLSEDYVGDGSASFEAGARKLGEVCFKTVDVAGIEQVAEVQAGRDDPNSVTVVIRPLSRLQLCHRWRIVCQDREGAERLIEDLRKVMPSDES